MANKNMPTHEIRFGAIRATIWANTSSSGECWFNLTIGRLYKDTRGNWQEAHTYTVRHLPEIVKVIEEACRWIEHHSVTKDGREAVESLVQMASRSGERASRRAS